VFLPAHLVVIACCHDGALDLLAWGSFQGLGHSGADGMFCNLMQLLTAGSSCSTCLVLCIAAVCGVHAWIYNTA
jgi:hypothetical protein